MSSPDKIYKFQQMLIFSSPEQRSRIAIVLPLASINVKVFAKAFKISLSNLITDLIHLWYDYTY